jgi:hypothetical protein
MTGSAVHDCPIFHLLKGETELPKPGAPKGLVSFRNVGRSLARPYERPLSISRPIAQDARPHFEQASESLMTGGKDGRRLGVGLDFGTSNSAAAGFDGTTLRYIALEGVDAVMPTAIHLNRNYTAITGSDAIDQYVEENRGRLVELGAGRCLVDRHQLRYRQLR